MSVLAPNSALVCRENHPGDHHQLLISGGGSGFALPRWWSGGGFGAANRRSRSGRKAGLWGSRNQGFWPDLSRPTAVRMESIADSDQLDQILQQARQRSQPVVVDWMAAWCRKCIYLKPKLEKLSAEYETKVRFYYVDVNRVPKTLVKRGNISKMPTIQLWKDGEMKEEVIGGHKAWLVLEEVREMIQRFV